MLDNLQPQPTDKIIEMIGLYKADPRSDKIDLGVGVYKNAQGETPIMKAVKAAEERLWQKQTSKSYVALNGQAAFLDAMRELSLGESVDHNRIAAVQTPGGTGAIRQLYELIQRANPQAKIWVSKPSWPNHIAIMKHLGITPVEYTYFNPSTGVVDFDAMKTALQGLEKGDVVILHGCCHNPTGANLTIEEWNMLADLLNAKGAIALIDLAYQGFGDGLEADVEGLRAFSSKTDEMFLALSCSKNFGLYRDRVGAALVVSKTSETAHIAQGNLNSLNRLNYSFPPDHGAALVCELFEDAQLVQEWKDELEAMRVEMLEKRRALAQALRRETNSDRFDFVENHRGMFSLLGISPEAVMKLRADEGIYIVHDSRINIAGLKMSDIDRFSKAIASVVDL